MRNPRVIKKYPNRRLYDTVESRYITLMDVRRLVLERIEFVVVERRTDNDLTRVILLQVIAEQERAAAPILSQDFMKDMIRVYGSSEEAQIGGQLEQTLRQLVGRQSAQKPQPNPENRASATTSK
jgi:polyhydroxyalkanoate synthesis repressor PhaR